jgi:hypothetical protein
MDGGGNDCIEEGLHNGRLEVRIRSCVKKNRGIFVSGMYFFVLSFQTTKLVVDKTPLR